MQRHFGEKRGWNCAWRELDTDHLLGLHRCKGALELPRQRGRKRFDARDNAPASLKSRCDLHLIANCNIIGRTGWQIGKDKSATTVQLDEWLTGTHDGALGGDNMADHPVDRNSEPTVVVKPAKFGYRTFGFGQGGA